MALIGECHTEPDPVEVGVIIIWSMLLVLGCEKAPNGADSGPPPSCEERFSGAPPSSAEDIVALVDVAQGAYFPWDEMDIVFVELTSQSVFFQANLDINTLNDPPLERTYTLQYNPVLFDDPPSQGAVGAILVHELKHILDYTEMDADALVEFALWYASGDVAEYERQTDEYALEAGCAEGLKGYREWLYAHIPPEDVEAKRRDYYTPEEIDAWVEASGR